MTSPLEQKFKKLLWLINNGPPNPNPPSVDRKLLFYSYFKQATEGDITAPQPGIFSIEARTKWNAWNKVKGMSKEEAMQKYIDTVAESKSPPSTPPLISFEIFLFLFG